MKSILTLLLFLSCGIYVHPQTTQPPSVAPCPISMNICKNYGFCVILFGKDITCTCPVGFTGSCKKTYHLFYQNN